MNNRSRRDLGSVRRDRFEDMWVRSKSKAWCTPPFHVLIQHLLIEHLLCARHTGDKTALTPAPGSQRSGGQEAAEGKSESDIISGGNDTIGSTYSGLRGGMRGGESYCRMGRGLGRASWNSCFLSYTMPVAESHLKKISPSPSP